MGKCEDAREITLELTDYCPHSCRFCSSSTVPVLEKARFLPMAGVRAALGKERWERVILSGGEPLAHPDFYKILTLCEARADDVVVYTNALKHLAYNARVIDGVYVEAALSVPEGTGKVRILKRVLQGREATRPEVSLSRNWYGPCDCKNVVVRPDGTMAPTPCRKDQEKP
jgi:hypothetical protein